MKRLLIALAFLLPAGLALAAPPTAPPTSWYPPASVVPPSLSVTSSSGRVALTADQTVYPVITIVNNGSAEIFCKPGGSTVTAATNSYTVAIAANGYRALWDNVSTYVACITASGTATARITQSNGAPQVGYVSTPTGLPPSGAAGGDLSGTYPNPNVVSFNGGTLFGTAAGVDTGTSGAKIPLLSTANTWTLGQTFSTSVTIGAGSAITSSGPGGALGSNAFTSTAYLPLAGGTLTGVLGVNLNATALPTKQTGTIIQIANTDGVAPRFELDPYGTSGFLSVVRRSGTAASPTQCLAAEQIGGFNAFALDNAAAIQGPIASVRTYCAENITASAMGSTVALATIATGGTTLTDRFKATGVELIVPAATTSGMNYYNTADETTNYERVRGSWSSNIFTLNTQAGGTGVVRNFIVGATSGGSYQARGTGTTAYNELTHSQNGTANIIGTRIVGIFDGSSGVSTEASVLGTSQQSGTAGMDILKVVLVKTSNGSGTYNLFHCLAGASGTTEVCSIKDDGTFTTIGGVSALSIASSNNVTAATSLIVSGKLRIGSPSDGIGLITNDGITDFTRLDFGGTTSSFPALKRSGTTIGVVLADNSGDAGITASSFSVPSNFSINTSGGTPSISVPAAGNARFAWQGSGSVLSSGTVNFLSISSTLTQTSTAGSTQLDISPTITSMGSGTQLGINVTMGNANTTGQLRLSYDSTHYVNWLVSSAGNTTVSQTGGTSITFSSLNLVANSLTAGASQGIGWVGRDALTSTSNGNVSILANNGTTPSNLTIGGLTTGSTTLQTTSVALTNGAAAQVGTLTNAPTAGNPTKWVPINDNGTTRYIPTW